MDSEGRAYFPKYCKWDNELLQTLPRCWLRCYAKGPSCMKNSGISRNRYMIWRRVIYRIQAKCAMLKGFEGFLSSSKSTTLLKRSRKFQPEDRLFSLSSVTSPAAEEIARDGGVSANGPGKPKKGRGPREAKRRQSSEADFDYEDDPDLM
ncbi:UNVERIFIED_CONTAM: hypothetical protein Sangu_2497100 [Sesamum angustifolium]|uniref:Uncharacterized protein n=1 Tax=Sesamum angustifolium TaxID=2727405 RepID=A0AAW2KF01_9LAMI